jgi:hypothetical protein
MDVHVAYNVQLMLMDSVLVSLKHKGVVTTHVRFLKPIITVVILVIVDPLIIQNISRVSVLMLIVTQRMMQQVHSLARVEPITRLSFVHEVMNMNHGWMRALNIENKLKRERCMCVHFNYELIYI